MTRPQPPAPGWADPVVWLPPALALVALAALVLTGSNESLFLTLNRWAAPIPDPLWAGITILGDTLVVLAIMLAVQQRFPEVVWAMLLAAVVATLLAQGMKIGLGLPRPPAVLPEGDFRLVGPGYHGRSFPSGHTTTAFTVAGVVTLYLRGAQRLWLAVPVVVLALAVAVSRTAVGIHWPQDLLAGIAVGWASAVAGVAWAAAAPKAHRPAARFWINALLLLSALAVLLVHDTGYPQAVKWQQIIAVLSLTLACYWSWPALPNLIREVHRRLVRIGRAHRHHSRSTHHDER